MKFVPIKRPKETLGNGQKLSLRLLIGGKWGLIHNRNFRGSPLAIKTLMSLLLVFSWHSGMT